MKILNPVPNNAYTQWRVSAYKQSFWIIRKVKIFLLTLCCKHRHWAYAERWQQAKKRNKK